jgi:hypothetical protein
MIEYFGKMGVEPKRILWLLNKPSVEDIGIDDMQLLIGLTTAIKDGDTTVDEAFPSKDPKAAEPEPEKPKSQAQAAAAKRQEQKPPESPPESEPEPETPSDTPEAPASEQADANAWHEALMIELDTAGFDTSKKTLTRGKLCDLTGIASARLVKIMAGSDKPTLDELSLLEERANVLTVSVRKALAS